MRLSVFGLVLCGTTRAAGSLALVYLSLATVNLVRGSSPVVVALMAIVTLPERRCIPQWLGVGIATLVGVVNFYPATLAVSQTAGIVVAAIGVICRASGSILGRGINRMGEISPLVIAFTSMGVSSVALIGPGIALQGVPKIGVGGRRKRVGLPRVNSAFAFTSWNRTLRSLSVA